MKVVIRCSRCNRRARRLDGWNSVLEEGVVVAYVCPGCQTPTENAEAEVNEATTVYGRTADGRLTGRPKR